MSSLNALQKAIEVCFATAEICFVMSRTESTTISEAAAIEVAHHATIVAMFAANSVADDLWQTHKSQKIPFFYDLDLLHSIKAYEADVGGGAQTLAAYSNGALSVVEAYVEAGGPIMPFTKVSNMICLTAAEACTKAAEACTRAATASGTQACIKAAKLAATTANEACATATAAAEALCELTEAKKDAKGKARSVEYKARKIGNNRIQGDGAEIPGMSPRASKLLSYISRRRMPMQISEEVPQT